MADRPSLGRTIWKGEVKAEDLEVPFRMYTAVREDRISFNLLHRKEGARLRQMMVCKDDNTPVPKEERIRGFEISEGKYIPVDDEDIEKSRPESDRKVEVLHYVKIDELDPRYLDRPYILRPSGNREDFRKLCGSLLSSGRAAVCRWVMRNRTYLGVLKFQRGLLCMITLRYGNEIIPLDSMEIEETDFKKKEIKTARDLIDAMTEDFEPQNFKNEFREEMLKVIKKKEKGGELEVAPEPEIKSTPPDKLIHALEKSLEKARGKAGA